MTRKRHKETKKEIQKNEGKEGAIDTLKCLSFGMFWRGGDWSKNELTKKVGFMEERENNSQQTIK